MSPVMRKNYVKNRAQVVVTYIAEYINTRLWTLENLVPTHKLTQCLQIVFGRTDAVREKIDITIKQDDEIRRKKCMRYLKLPRRFPIPDDIENEGTATWINWIHLETQALIEDLNEEIRLQNETDDPFTQNIVYAPINLIQETREIFNNQELTEMKQLSSEILPHEQHKEDKLTSAIPEEKISNQLPQRTNYRHKRRQENSKIPPPNKDIRSKPPVHTMRTQGTRQQINYATMNCEGNNTLYLQLPSGRQNTAMEQAFANDTADIRLCHRCGGEGHIRKYCNMNVYCEFCKSYSHDTSVCRLYANFIRAHPMALSRRTSPAQVNRQTEWTQPELEDGNITRTNSQNQGRETGRSREILDITRRHLEQVINTMIPSVIIQYFGPNRKCSNK